MSLAGRTIALPESRELDRLAELVEEDGGTAWRCPLITIRDAPDPGPAEAWVRTLAAGKFDDVIFLTGEGLRRLLATADRLGLREAALGGLARARKITRGPKPARALHELGLGSDLAAAVPTSAGVIAELARLDLSGRSVGVQLYGEEPNRPLIDALTQAGATPHPVAPYVYASVADEAAVRGLIDALAAGRIDAIAFTSASQIDRLFAVATAAGAEPSLRAALTRTRVAAIGPIAVEALAGHGVRADVVPEKGFVMRRLVNALAEALGPRSS
ncbi:MAG TPA: uroporphyrinogen-III synthase [Polyangia bacterium]|nr:uroporphyrinogen-III synthase [Polyangia bacterium]